jgi:hypothetical protein
MNLTGMIAILQGIFNDSDELKTHKTDLVYIHANFSFLSQHIIKLEKTKNLLSETIIAVSDIQEELNKIKVLEYDAVKQIFYSYFSKDKGFKFMCDISCIL